MPLAFASQQLGDGGLVDADQIGDALLCVGITQREDPLDNRAWGAANETEGHGVLVVPFLGYPFKIPRGVVGFDRVDVVDLRQVKWIGNEGAGHKSVNAHQLSHWVNYQPHFEVAPIASDRLQKPSPEGLLAPVSSHDDPIQASDLSEVAHFVKRGELNEFHRPPFFNAVHNCSIQSEAIYTSAYCHAQGD